MLPEKKKPETRKGGIIGSFKPRISALINKRRKRKGYHENSFPLWRTPSVKGIMWPKLLGVQNGIQDEPVTHCSCYQLTDKFVINIEH